jgi:hypothetical protein
LPTLETAVAWVEENASMLIKDGDYDFDGDVDSGDYATWRSQFGSAGPFPLNGDFADGTRDGRVDGADYVFWRDKLGGSAASIGATSGVPEPALLALGGWGVAAALLRRREWTNGAGTHAELVRSGAVPSSNALL